MKADGSLALDKALPAWSILLICCCINIEAALAAVLANLDTTSICLEKNWLKYKYTDRSFVTREGLSTFA